jgi:uncharacterized membrane protein (UPF0127 family)
VIAKNSPWVWKGVAIAVILLLLAIFSFLKQDQKGTIVCPDGTILSVAIADEPQEQRKGLSGVPSLSGTEGMLFLYGEAGYPTHWMKDMLIPIDMVWLLDGTIVFMVQEVFPVKEGEELMHYRPDTLANQVLEVPAGFVEKHGIFVGDRLDVRLP